MYQSSHTAMYALYMYIILHLTVNDHREDGGGCIS